jgi:hypothetical protein
LRRTARCAAAGPVMLERGQLLISVRAFAVACDITHHRMRAILARLAAQGMVQCRSTGMPCSSFGGLSQSSS